MIITGSGGLIGKKVTECLRKKYSVLELGREYDLSNEKFVKEWFKEHHADYLVNLFAHNDHVKKNRNNIKSDLFSISLDSIMEYLKVNVISLFSVCCEFAKNNNKSGIVNFSSIYGLVSPVSRMYPINKKHFGYCISKTDVIQLTKYLAVHLSPKCRVNCFVLGGVFDNQPDRFVKEYEKRVPMRRMMDACEVCGMIEYLCSDKSSYVTGSTMIMDGGWTAQ